MKLRDNGIAQVRLPNGSIRVMAKLLQAGRARATGQTGTVGRASGLGANSKIVYN